MLSDCSAAVGDSTWAHAARLGFAWRRLRKDVSLCRDPDSAILFDLHAELLQRLGHRLRPLTGCPLPHNLRRASSDVRSALGYLRILASRTATSSALLPGGIPLCGSGLVTDKLRSNSEVLGESGLSVDFDSGFGKDCVHGYTNDLLSDVEVLGNSVGSLGGSLRDMLVDHLAPVGDSLLHVEDGLSDVRVLVTGCSSDLADVLLRASALEVRTDAELADFRRKLLLGSGTSFCLRWLLPYGRSLSPTSSSSGSSKLVQSCVLIWLLKMK